MPYKIRFEQGFLFINGQILLIYKFWNKKNYKQGLPKGEQVPLSLWKAFSQVDRN